MKKKTLKALIIKLKDNQEEKSQSGADKILKQTQETRPLKFFQMFDKPKLDCLWDPLKIREIIIPRLTRSILMVLEKFRCTK